MLNKIEIATEAAATKNQMRTVPRKVADEGRGAPDRGEFCKAAAGSNGSDDGDLESPADGDGLVFRLIGSHPLRTRAGRRIGAKFDVARGLAVQAH
jgi:hypothetical protein